MNYSESVNNKPISHISDEALPKDVVVSVRGVNKKFCRNLRRSMAYGIADLTRNLIGIKSDSTTLKRDEFWALKNLSFELRKGETLGLIGLNGSGKTTLLRILAGIFPPDAGEIIIRGRVGALIALGAGFHPHMTGRENVYLNGSLLGMSLKEIDSKYNSIVSFSEIGEFIDAPVSTYSSGMWVRLGFAVAAYLNPKILLVDEILSVGDSAFRRKCIQHMKRFIDNGGTCVFVSHDMHMVQSFCSTCLLLNHGELKYIGETSKALNQYFEKQKTQKTKHFDRVCFSTNDENPVTIENITVSPLNDNVIYTGHNIRVTLHYQSTRYINAVEWVLSIWTGDQWSCISTVASNRSSVTFRIINGRGHLSCIFPSIKLVAGTYAIKSNIQDIDTRLPLASSGYDDGATYFKVKGSGSEVDNRHRIDGDLIVMDVKWEL